jgi:hypothetical protein
VIRYRNHKGVDALNRIIGEIPKNALEKVVATLGEFKGKPRIDLRVYFKPDVSEPDKWLPTKKGINLDPGSWQDFKELVGKVDKALDQES